MNLTIYRYTIHPSGFSFVRGTPERSGRCYLLRNERMPFPLFGYVYTIRDIDTQRIYKVSEWELELKEEDAGEEEM